jgi:HPt (histidine-containing phosphotransfer) domain-containing protein
MIINATAVDELVQQIEPWLALLTAQSDGETMEPDLRQAFFAELSNATQDYAQIAQRANLRGLSNVTMLLLRGLNDRKSAPLDDDDVAQLTLWLSGVQSYLDAQLDDSSCLLLDLQALNWIPRLAPAAVNVLQERIREPVAALAELAAMRLANAAEQSFLDVPADANLNAVDESPIEQTNAAETTFDIASEPLVAIALEEMADSEDEVDGFDFDSLGQLGVIELSEDVSQAPAMQELPASFALTTLATEATEENDDSVIWIAHEEFQLVTETVQSRLLPVLSDLAAEDAPDKLAAHYGETQYQIELLSNAFAVLGLANSQAMCVDLLAVISAPGNDRAEIISERAPALMQWVVSLVDFCGRPDAVDAQESLISLVASSDWIAPQNAAENAALAQELTRIRVGMDPSLKAARRTEFSEADADLSPAEDVMPNVLQGMLLELPDNAHNLSAQIETYVRSGDPEAIDQARRVSHTLKGDANTVGIKGIANLTHSLEDIFIEVAKAPEIPSRGFADMLTQAADCVAAMARSRAGPWSGTA